MASQELSIRNRISEDVARSEQEAMERDARHALFCQDQWFKIAFWDYQRQARDAINQAVRESSENYEVRMMPEFQGAQHRCEVRMEENERRATQVIGSYARDAPRGQRSTCCMNIKFFFKQETEKRRSWKVRYALGAAVTQCRSRRSWHEREVLQERISQNWEYQEAQRRVQLQIEEPMMTSPKDNSQEASESEMQAVVSTTVGDFSWKRNVAGTDSLWFLGDRSNQTYHGSGGTKHEDNWKEPSYCSSVHLPSSRMECSQPFTPPEKVDSNRCDPQNAIRREHIPSTSIAVSDTRSVTDESAPKKERNRETLNLSVGRKRQNSVLGKSLSAEDWQQDQLVFDWSTDGQQKLLWYHMWTNWTIQDSHATARKWDFETRESKIVKRIMKIVQPNSREWSITWWRLNGKTNVQCLRANKLCFTFFYTVNKTQGHTEWCTWPWFVWRQSQDVQPGWEENMASPWSWFGCTCPGERVWATNEKITTHEACDELKSAEHFWKRNREATNDNGLWLIAFSNSNSKPNWLLKKRPIKRKQQQHTLQRAEEQGT